MRTNLTYILLVFCLFCYQISAAQDIGNSRITSKKTKKKTIINQSKDSLIDLKKEQLLNFKKDSIANDSIKPKEVIDGIITHNAEDYTIQNAKNKTVTLYNKAQVTYTDIDLKAGIIVLDYKNNTVYAKGIKDSLGYHQKPVFKQGAQESEQDSILFNFKTKKALIYGVKTVQDGIITYAEKTKRVNDSTIYMRKMRFTTSKKKRPDYYIQTSKAKLVPGKKIIIGASHLVLADVPTPLVLPFAYFPLTDKRTSGFIIPSWGENNSQGFFMQNGGYYFALSDYFDLTVLGDLYTNGSWGLQVESSYYVRYKFSGNFNFQFQNNIQGIRGLSNYNKSNSFNIRWSHNQDSKASPNSKFSAAVNLGSSRFFLESQNQANNARAIDNSLNSSISYYKKFVGTPFNMSLTLQHGQNTNTEKITMTLPSLQVNSEPLYPFTGKDGAKNNAIQKMGFNYNMQGRYEINTTDDEFFTPKMFKTAKSGVQHSLSTSTSLKAFKYFTLSPNASYKDVWYFDKIHKRYDPKKINASKNLGAVVNDTISGFNRYHNYNFGASLSTNIYGTFNFKKGRLKAIRHTIRPSISYGYTPNFAKNHDLQVQQSSDPTDLRTYSPFKGGIYGTPGSGTSNRIGIAVNNVLEAKVAPKDPDSDADDQKIMLLNNLDFSTRYDITKDSIRWSDVSVNASTRLFKDKLALNTNMFLDPYQIDKNGKQIDKFNANLFRVKQIGLTANYSLSSKDFSKNKEGEKNPNKNNGNGAQDTPDLFGQTSQNANDFSNTSKNKNKDVAETVLYHHKIPWTLNLIYTMNYGNDGLKSGININTLRFSGNIELSPKWGVGFNSGYDIKNNGFSYTNLNFSRDLDSWRLNFGWTPFGPRTSYNFFIGVKSAVLSDLKWDKNKPPDRALF
ncbi:putative LPS assembly protein LptD [Tenacibaculum finnmarkense]|uniref:putative LPS assembly protein LptD n=1 Tax=Tenacibaculum finnmarkense TaxID=2781243 RepID=UPI001E4A8847|nr:putative LPS assembly protein LptD [Tenacibaculum finnmarkense]MCD8447014.1 LPS-assembly protein LptD [Tenacibaculum finnmarkense genomovar finnmarkense]WCC47800.1 putative LPS assembly protein LptD [Tenacibaculum finnmarkense]